MGLRRLEHLRCAEDSGRSYTHLIQFDETDNSIPNDEATGPFPLGEI